VIDASAKVPSGVLDGHYKWLGSYDECLKVRHKVQDTSMITGKHCIVIVPIGIPPKMVSCG